VVLAPGIANGCIDPPRSPALRHQAAMLTLGQSPYLRGHEFELFGWPTQFDPVPDQDELFDDGTPLGSVRLAPVLRQVGPSGAVSALVGQVTLVDNRASVSTFASSTSIAATVNDPRHGSSMTRIRRSGLRRDRPWIPTRGRGDEQPARSWVVGAMFEPRERFRQIDAASDRTPRVAFLLRLGAAAVRKRLVLALTG
jgi:hypothetical protein